MEPASLARMTAGGSARRPAPTTTQEFDPYQSAARTSQGPLVLVASLFRVPPARLLATLTLAAAVLLAAGLAGACPLLVAVGLAVALPALLSTVALVRQGLFGRDGVACPDPVLWVAAAGGIAAAALTAVALPVAAPEGRPLLAAAGLVATAGLLMVALTAQVGTGWLARLRAGWDGLTSGAAVALAGWLLIPDPGTGAWFGYVAAITTCAVTMLGLSSLWRADRRDRPAMLYRVAGATLVTAGQALLGIALGGTDQILVLAAAVLLLAGPPALWTGIRTAPRGVADQPRPPGGQLLLWSGGLFLLLAVAIAALIMSYQLLVAGRLDQGALPLVVVLGLVLAVREALGEAERRRGVRLLARCWARLRVLDRAVLSQPLGTDRFTGAANQRELLRAIAARQQVNQATGALLVIGLTDQESEPGVGLEPAVLRIVADRLRARVGRVGLVGRCGGDEFAVVTGEGPVEAYALGLQLKQVLAMPYPGGPARVTPSVGVTDLAGGTPEEVLRRGRLARRRAEKLSSPRIDWYDESMEHRLVRRLDLERHFPGAAGRRELDLVYQPVLELATGRPVGVEALLRWRHPVLGTVLPGEFLPVAEKLRASPEIAHWALHTACRQVAAWRRAGYDLWLAVNVSASQLSADFVPEVAAALSVHQCPPERLVVEIAEAEIDDLDTVAEQLSRLRALGVRICLDDFGTDQTDLGRLRRLPLDLVKLGAPRGAEPASDLVRAMVGLAQRLGLSVVVKGLETRAQVEAVMQAGCQHGQGFQLAAPAPASHIERYLTWELGPVS